MKSQESNGLVLTSYELSVENATRGRRRRIGRQRGFTLVELLVVIAIIGILIGMFLPATRRARGAALRATCMNHLRQIALASHNYDCAHQKFPAAMGGDSFVGNRAKYSGFVELLPFLEEKQTYDQIATESQFNGVDFPAFPPVTAANYDPWRTAFSGFHCPASTDSNEREFGRTNYAFCIGDQARKIHGGQFARGAFACGKQLGYDDIKDGTSNTIGFMEIGSSAGKRVTNGMYYAIDRPSSELENPSLWLDGGTGSGLRFSSLARGEAWANGTAGPAIVQTILPPGSPSFSIGGEFESDGLYSAANNHPGVIVVTMMDGSGQSISVDVDCGDLTKAPPTEQEMLDREPSPYGVWGALGTSSAEETVALSDL